MTEICFSKIIGRQPSAEEVITLDDDDSPATMVIEDDLLLRASPLMEFELLRPGTDEDEGRGERSRAEILHKLKELELAIHLGNKVVASRAVDVLCELKTRCYISWRKEENDREKVKVNLYVEDEKCHVGPLLLEVHPGLPIVQVKKKIEKEFSIPSSVQRYKTGEMLVENDATTLAKLGINSDGCVLNLQLAHYNDAVNEDERIEEDQPVIVGFGWICAACTRQNDADWPGCDFCAAARPRSYEIPSEYLLGHDDDDDVIFVDQPAAKQNRPNSTIYQQLLTLDSTELAFNKFQFTCSICVLNVEPGDGVMLKECLHWFCRDCLVNHIRHSEEPIILCPFIKDDHNCAYHIQEREIRALVPPDIFSRYLRRSVSVAERNIGNSFHCKTPDCPGWCIYDESELANAGTQKSVINVFPCQVCQKANCLTCQAIHEGMDCLTYQQKLELEAGDDEDKRRSLDHLKELLATQQAMRCPNCRVIIVKVDGCNHIHCTMCRRDITWQPGGTL